MDLVIDANILFAALIKESTTSELLFREISTCMHQNLSLQNLQIQETTEIKNKKNG